MKGQPKRTSPVIELVRTAAPNVVVLFRFGDGGVVAVRRLVDGTVKAWRVR